MFAMSKQNGLCLEIQFKIDWTINNLLWLIQQKCIKRHMLDNLIFIYWAWYLSFKIVNNLNSHFKVIKINVTSLNPPFIHFSIPHNQYTIFTHLNINIYHHSKYVTEKEGETQKICITLKAQSTFHPPPHTHTHFLLFSCFIFIPTIRKTFQRNSLYGYMMF